MPAYTIYRSWLAVLALALPCLASTCGSDLDDSCPNERAGSLGLRPASQAWLPLAPPDSIRFINSNGFQVSLRRDPSVETAADSVIQPALPSYGPAHELYAAQSYPNCGPYFQTARRRLRYFSPALPIELTYALVRDLSGAYPAGSLPASQVIPQVVADTLPDVVLVRFNETTFGHFPVTRRPNYQSFRAVRYLDSARVAGRTFFGVYQQTLLNATGSSSAVRPRMLYFMPGQGIVGFTYTNNEEWARF